jgi:multidrug resistance protein
VTSVFILGYVFGPILIAPLSEIYGRSLLYNICNFLIVIWSMACALSPNLASLIVFRFFAGIASSCPITLGAGSIADMIPVEKRGFALMAWILGPVIGPTCGPLIGAYLSQAKGWRWIFWLLTIVSGAVAILCVLLIRESFPYTILDRKTKRLRKETGNSKLRSALDSGRDPKTLLLVSLVRPIKMMFLSPIVFLMSLYMAIGYSYLYLLFTTFPRVFQGIYHFSDGSLGLAYMGVGVGSTIALLGIGFSSDRILKSLTKKNHGVAKPEFRLPVMLVSAWVLPAGLFIYGWTADKGVHWMVPIVGTAIVGLGIFPLFMAISAYLIDAYTIYAASAAAAATVMRSLFGALIPLAGNKMYDAMGIGWGTSLLGFIAAVFIPVPYIFWIYGERIRTSKWGKVEF